MATSSQLAFISVLMKKNGFSPESVAQMCQEVSFGDTDRPEELNTHKCSKLIEMLNFRNPSVPDKMRKRILSMAHELGWRTPDHKVDVARVDRWCRDYGYLKKGFNDHARFELPKLVSQFEQMYEKAMKGPVQAR